MLVESLVVKLPARLVQELEEVGQEYLADIVERGLRSFRIERALEGYAEGGHVIWCGGQARGFSQGELARQAYARGMEPPATETSLNEELG